MSITRHSQVVPSIGQTRCACGLVGLKFYQDNRVTEIGQRFPHSRCASAVCSTALSFDPGARAVKQQLPLGESESPARRNRQPVEIVAD